MSYSSPLSFNTRNYQGFDLPYIADEYWLNEAWTTVPGNGSNMSHITATMYNDITNVYSDWISKIGANGRLDPWIRLVDPKSLSSSYATTIYYIYWLSDNLLILSCYNTPTNKHIYYITTDFVNYTLMPAFISDIFATSFILLPDGKLFLTGDNITGTTKQYWVSSLDHTTWTAYSIPSYIDAWGEATVFDGKVYLICYLASNGKPYILSCTDPTLNVWDLDTSAIPDTNAYAPAFFSYENYLWVVSGRADENGYWYKNKITNVWTSISPFTEVISPATFSLGSSYPEKETIFVALGDFIYYYDLTTDTWAQATLDSGLKRQIDTIWYDDTLLLNNKVILSFDGHSQNTIAHSLVNPAVAPLLPPPTPLTFTVNTALSGGTARQITLELYHTPATNMIINWGDGTTIDYGTTARTTIARTYAVDGIYTISISGGIRRFNGITQKNRLTSIVEWNTFGYLTNLSYVFAYTTASLTSVPASLPSTVTDLSYMLYAIYSATPNVSNIVTWNTSNVTNMTHMFDQASVFNQNISAWNTGSVTNMSYMFNNAYAFNQNISSWNTANVTNMTYMFYNANAFNQPIGSWNTGSVTDMSYMFYDVNSFNQPLNGWNTGNVTNMSYMFYYTSVFQGAIDSWNTANVTNMSWMFANTAYNQPIGSWNTIKVTNMSAMFYQAYAFNQSLNGWNTIAVTTMAGMFQGAAAFNGNISSWNTSNVTNMSQMFYQCYLFNQNISAWDTSKNTTMELMFYYCYSFNQPIGSWNTGNVTNMRGVFWVPPANASIFNQPIGTWDTTKVTNMSQMFYSADVFNQPINSWNTGNVTSMSGMFDGAAAFNQDLNSWDTTKVISMSDMFFGAAAFNGNITTWNTANVISMSYMFRSAQAFNQNINSWNTSKVTSMTNMFTTAYLFNQNLNSWDTSNVTTMVSMFYDAAAFNGNISNWNTANVTNMSFMFAETDNFNSDISTWNTINVTNMTYMFYNAAVFNKDLSGWDVPKITSLPSNFAWTTPAWVLPKPVWGTSPHTVLLMHFNETNGSTTTVDSSTYYSSVNTPINAIDNAQISTAQFRFSTASSLFDGVGDYFPVPAGTHFEFGTTGYMGIECFIRRNSAVTGLAKPFIALAQNGGADGPYYELRLRSDNKVEFKVVDSTSATVCEIYTTSTIAVTTSWYHIAVCFNATGFKIYLNGTNNQTTVTNNLGPFTWPICSGSPLTIGGSPYIAGGLYFNGYVDEVRIIKGISPYNANFTAPSVAFVG